MRLLQGRVLGTLAITSGLLAPLVSGQAGLENPAITFKNGFYGPLPAASTDPIFTPIPSQVFTFEIRSGIIVADVVLLNEDTSTIASATNGRSAAITSSRAAAIPAIAPTGTSTTSPDGAMATPKATATTSEGLDINPPAALATGRSISGSLGNREDDGNLTLTIEPTTGNITYNSLSLLTTYLYQKLYLRVGWEDSSSGMSGYTYSRDFVYVNQADASSGLTSVLPLVTATSAVYPETTFPETATATSAATKTSSTAKATGTDSSGGALTPGGKGTTSSRKKGLATGAIVGIVIGIVAAVAIVGGIVFYLYRRRARSGRLSGSAETYHGSGSEQIGLQSGFALAGTVEKDGIVNGSVSGFGNGANGGNHSPYSDDDGTVGAGVGVVHERSVGASPTATTAHAENLSAPASPVSTLAQPASEGPATGPATEAATAAPKPGVSGQVAALIEEDMTAEDVARLEAEERELDAAIETAMRGRHASQAGQP